MMGLNLSAVMALLAMLLFGLIAGFFYAFSVDVMRGLNTIDPLEAIHAMQGINTEVRNPVFFVTFFMTPVIALAAAAVLHTTGSKLAAIIMICAAVLYIAGAFMPTVLINVPMNEALGALVVTPGDQNIADIWEDYSSRWTFWNTARMIVSSGSLLLSGLAIFAIRHQTQ